MLHKNNENRPYHNSFSDMVDGTSALSYDAAYTEKNRFSSEKQHEAINDRTAPILSVAMVDEDGNLTVLPLEEDDEEGEDEPSADDLYTDDDMTEAHELQVSAQRVNIPSSNGFYIPMGQEYARSIDESFIVDSQTDPSPSEGIVYDVAEELYLREKTAAKLQALCKPPFRKIFDQEQLMQLNKQAEEKARLLLSDTSGSKGTVSGSRQPISTAAAFLLQLLMMIPLLNIPAILWFAMYRGANQNLKSYSRAFLIWTSLFLTAALVYFAFSYFTNPVQNSVFTKIADLFSSK